MVYRGGQVKVVREFIIYCWHCNSTRFRPLCLWLLLGFRLMRQQIGCEMAVCFGSPATWRGRMGTPAVYTWFYMQLFPKGQRPSWWNAMHDHEAEITVIVPPSSIVPGQPLLHIGMFCKGHAQATLLVWFGQVDAHGNEIFQAMHQSWKVQWGMTPAGPPSYTAAQIIPDLSSPTNAQVDIKMAGYILAGSRPRPCHFRRLDTLFSGTGQGTRDDSATLFPIFFWRPPYEE